MVRLILAKRLFILSIFLTALTFASIRVYAAEDLVVGIVDNNRPFAYATSKNSSELQGFDVTTLRSIAVKMSRRLQLVTGDFDYVVNQLADDKVDMIMGSITLLDSELEQYRRVNGFVPTVPYGSILIVVITRSDKTYDFKSISQGVGRVAVITGSYAERLVKSLNNKVTSFYRPRDAITEVILQRADMAVLPFHIAQPILINNNRVSHTSIPAEPAKLVILMRSEDTALKAEVDKAIEELHKELNLNNILTEYLTKQPGTIKKPM